MNDTSKPADTSAADSYESFEHGLEAMIVALELFKEQKIAIPSVALAAINLAGPLMLNTLVQKFGWSTAELIARLSAQREQLHEMADPLAQLTDLLGGAVKGQTEVHMHPMDKDEMERLRAALKAGDAKGIDDVITSIVGKGNGQTTGS